MKKIMNVKGRWDHPSLQQILHHTSIIILSSENAITEFSLFFSFFLLLFLFCVWGNIENNWWTMKGKGSYL